MSKFEIADKSTEQSLTWYDAEKYVKILGDGWRLPTKEELNQIYQSENDFDALGYWSGSESVKNGVWVQFFKNGFQDYYIKSYTCLVRPVRTLTA